MFEWVCLEFSLDYPPPTSNNTFQLLVPLVSHPCLLASRGARTGADNMALREKTPSSGWRSFSGSGRSTRDGGSFLTPNRRGAIYITLTLFFVWLVFGHGADDSAPALTSSLRNQAVRLTGGVLDEEIYGPPIPKHKQRPLHPQNSAFVPLHSWKDGVPETTMHGLSGGELVCYVNQSRASFMLPPFRLGSSRQCHSHERDCVHCHE